LANLVTAHLVSKDADLARLSHLDPELAVRAYDVEGLPRRVLEVFKRGRKDPWPLSCSLNRYHLSEAVIAAAPAFATVVDALRAHGYGAPGIHGELNTGLDISRLLGGSVISFVADDEEDGLCANADSGVLRRIRYRRGDLDIEYDGKVLHIFPLVPGDEDPDGTECILTHSAAEALRAISGVVVHDRMRPWPMLLHGLVVEELKLYLPGVQPILGLAEWNPPRELGLRQVASRESDGAMVWER